MDLYALETDLGALGMDLGRRGVLWGALEMYPDALRPDLGRQVKICALE